MGPMISAPSAQSRMMVTTIPPMSTSIIGRGKNRKVKCTVGPHREYIQDVAGSVDFANFQLAVNPGMEETFPWLSTIASRFETYSFHNLIFRYETSRASTTAGNVMLAIDYDAADAEPADKTQFMTYEGATRSVTWQECVNISSLENLSKYKERYVRSDTLAANLDIKTYDVGTLNVGTSGQTDVTVVGELYVEYYVNFYTPQAESLGAEASDSTQLSAHAGAPNINKDQPFGDAPTQDPPTQPSRIENQILVLPGSVFDGAIRTPMYFGVAGSFLLSFFLEGVAIANTPYMKALLGGSLRDLMASTTYAGVFQSIARVTSNGVTSMTITLALKVFAPFFAFFSANSGTTSISDANVWVSEFDADNWPDPVNPSPVPIPKGYRKKAFKKLLDAHRAIGIPEDLKQQLDKWRLESRARELTGILTKDAPLMKRNKLPFLENKVLPCVKEVVTAPPAEKKDSSPTLGNALNCKDIPSIPFNDSNDCSCDCSNLSSCQLKRVLEKCEARRRKGMRCFSVDCPDLLDAF